MHWSNTQPQPYNNPHTMSTTKHTPGPWTVTKVAPDKYPSGYRASVYYAIKANGSRIAQTSGEHMTQDAEANARLIAEAPALLALAKECERLLADFDQAACEDNGEWTEERKALEELRATIARAEGRA